MVDIIINFLKAIFNFIWSLVGYTNDFFKLAAWVTLIVTAVVLFGKQIRAGLLIRKFFITKGISFFSSFAVPFLSKNNCNKNTRLFIEYIVLSTTDNYIKRADWKRKILDFKADYIEKNNNTITIDDTFRLKDETVKENINSYFNFIKENKDVLNVSENDINRFEMAIIIKNAYLTPLIPISSLQERYNGEWSKVLDQYRFEFTDKKNKRMPTEVFSFYTWLMWGPSVCVIPKENETSCKLCILGLGDESMSIPVIIPANQKLDVWNKICDRINDNEFGSFVKGKYILYNKKPYLKENKNQFGGDLLNFVSDMNLDEENTLILETTKDVEEIALAKHTETMYAAYIWIMLQYSDDCNSSEFDCHNATVFFEHANISDSENVKIYTETLINKCIKYIKHSKECTEYSNRIYTVPWAVNNKIISEFKKAIEKEPELLEYVKFNKPCVSQEIILNSIDNAYRIDETEIRFKDIDFENPADLGLLGRFYCELYMVEFPDADERESFENIINQGKRMHLNTECEYHCIIAMQGESIVGGIMGDYFSECNSAACEFVVVNKSKRNLNVGTYLMSKFIDVCNNDANTYDDSRRTIDYCFFECENPNKVDPAIKDQCIGRLKFWDKKKAKRVNIDYVQTSLEESKQAIDYLYLCVILINDMKLSSETINTEKVMIFIKNYFEYAFKKESINDNEEYVSMLKENKNKNDIKLLSLV